MKLFKKIKDLFTSPKKKEPVKMENGTEQAPRMRTGNPNGILSVQERMHANREFNKKKKKKKANRNQGISRNINHARAKS